MHSNISIGTVFLVLEQFAHRPWALVETVSHSKDWKDTAILVVEDEPQDGGDRVSALRTEAPAISPDTQIGKVDSTLYDQIAMVRTVESILGMKPMSQFDASAVPMLNAFAGHPNVSRERNQEIWQSVHGNTRYPGPATAHDPDGDGNSSGR